MRRDTKLAILVAVVFLGLGAWYVFKDRITGGPTTTEQPVAVKDAATDKPGATAARDSRRKPDGAQPRPSPDKNASEGNRTYGPLAAASRRDPTGTDAPMGVGGTMANRPVAAPTSPTGLAGTTQPAARVGEDPRPTLAPAIGTESPRPGMGARVTPGSGEITLAGDNKPADSARTAGALTHKPAEQPRTHVVQAGETFTSLAVKYFGHARHANLITKANPDIEPRKMRVGMKLTIPPAPDSAAPTMAATASPTPPGGPAIPTATPITRSTKPLPVPTDRAYTVKAGEGWYTIAQRFLSDGRRWTELYELNKERVPHNPMLVPPGLTIELPKDANMGTTAGPSTKPATVENPKMTAE
ncbi:MAG TPA: LysM peptidoglycan-binding domain-containing protein [Phycisphaerae bacterium]|nr:LysM peptidoglycan-binding domain-containing protein [Phycisphaerae bacterium]